MGQRAPAARVSALIEKANTRPTEEDLATYNDVARRYLRLVKEEVAFMLFDDPPDDAFLRIFQLVFLSSYRE